ncbi:Delta-1-pyrroline-5-carboxylate dehydrogenase, mitochondrial [Nymphon striatum]|nr:Delta-1-pyrroline-5-carboxylate dehydrogenase, mitochondrial [Nymphon striatum]
MITQVTKGIKVSVNTTHYCLFLSCFKSKKNKNMGKGVFQVPTAFNEPIKSYAPGTPEREAVLKQYKAYFNGTVDVPMYIGKEEVKTGNTKPMSPPHDHKHVVGTYHVAEKSHVTESIESCLNARDAWANLAWEQRAAIFLKAAELLAGPYRAKINASTMIAQSKTVHQAEIDAACEFIDFLRFNVEYMTQIYEEQPDSAEGIWNRVEYRPLEVWKPSDSQIFSAKVIVDVFKEAGLPDGVINVIYGDPVMITNTVLDSPDFAGLHFTGSTHIVGETGGKDFIVAHKTAKPQQVATAIVRGSFEFQGQKCSAASRVYLPKSTADEILSLVKKDVESFNAPGSPEDLKNFVTAVIHEGSFDKLAKYIDQAKTDADASILVGGGYDKSKGYFIEPTVIVTTDPKYTTMETELFGPVVTIYVYEDCQLEYAIEEATVALQNCAGNFYINDKPTGAVAIKHQVIQLAEAFSAEQYDWRPMEGVNSVGESLMHVAGGNYFLASKMGFPPPADVDMMKLGEIKGKENIIAALKKSNEFVLAKIMEVETSALNEEVDFGFAKMNKLGGLLAIMEHNGEHKGQLIAYARSNGVVPPWSLPTWANLLLTILMGVGMAGVGMNVMHDGNHGSYSNKKWVNKLMGGSIYILAGNVYNWQVQHNVLHHTYTNIHEHDEDMEAGRVLRFSKHTQWKKHHKFQHLYSVLLYGLLTFNWAITTDFQQMYRYMKRKAFLWQASKSSNELEYIGNH